MKKKLLFMLTLILAVLPAFSQSSVTVQMSGMYNRTSNALAQVGESKNLFRCGWRNIIGFHMCWCAWRLGMDGLKQKIRVFSDA